MEVHWRCLLPQWAVLSLERMVSESEMYAGFADDWNVEPSPTAGQSAFVFLPHFVPIADNGCGETLFVDLRPGPLSGCVTPYLQGDADTHGPFWPSVSAMLEEVADSLESGVECAGCLPTVEEGELS